MLLKMQYPSDVLFQRKIYLRICKFESVVEWFPKAGPTGCFGNSPLKSGRHANIGHSRCEAARMGGGGGRSRLEWRDDPHQAGAGRAVIKATKKSSIRDVDLIDRTLGSSRLPAVFQLREGRRRADLRQPLEPFVVGRRPGPAQALLASGAVAASLRKRDYETRYAFALLALMAGGNPAYIAR